MSRDWELAALDSTRMLDRADCERNDDDTPPPDSTTDESEQ